MKRLIGIAGVGLLVIALVAGCGSSSDNGLTKQEFVTKADAICKKGSDDIDAAANTTFSDGKQPTDQETQQFATETVIPNIQSQIDQIKALDAPADDQDQVDAILSAAQSGVDKAKDDPTLVTDAQSNPLAEANKLAQSYGMKECGS